MKIILAGYMGSGKTTIGKEVAKYLNLPFYDLDTYIENYHGLTINEIFKSKGEIYFRNEESRLLEQFFSCKNIYVLSLGGGTPCYGNNLKKILSTTENTFYISVPLPELTRRLKNSSENRPLIKSLVEKDTVTEFIAKHLFERNQYYLQMKHVIIAKNKNKKVLAKEIIELL